MTQRNIGIIGAGNMGSGLATRLAAAGHTVSIAATDMANAEKAATAAGPNARAVQAAQVAQDADVLFLAVPYGAAVEALRSAGDLAGKVVVDLTNPLTADMAALVVGFDTSAAEEIQKAVPSASIVKGFNTVFAQKLGAPADEDKTQVFLASDNAAAKAQVSSIADSAGFDPVDAGPLSNARQLEPLGLLNIYFGYVAGRGTSISPAWVSAA